MFEGKQDEKNTRKNKQNSCHDETARLSSSCPVIVHSYTSLERPIGRVGKNSFFFTRANPV